MLSFTSVSTTKYEFKNTEIYSFVSDNNQNIDWTTVKSFGEEWGKFHEFSESEIKRIGDEYFDIIESHMINDQSMVLDVGCGSGRWSKYISRKVGFVEAIDPSSAVFQAAGLTESCGNVRVSQAAVDAIPFADNSFDLVFSLGVLHHIPDTKAAMKKCVEKVKHGGYFLVYLYYNFENRGLIFKTIYHLSDFLRYGICKLSAGKKKFVCDILAVLIYMPLILLSRLLDKIFFLRPLVKFIPLSWYRTKSFMVIRNDSLDRFGTPLEKRFSRSEITEMMKDAGLTDIRFSPNEPYWHAMGRKSVKV